MNGNRCWALDTVTLPSLFSSTDLPWPEEPVTTLVSLFCLGVARPTG